METNFNTLYKNYLIKYNAVSSDLELISRKSKALCKDLEEKDADTLLKIRDQLLEEFAEAQLTMQEINKQIGYYNHMCDADTDRFSRQITKMFATITQNIVKNSQCIQSISVRIEELKDDVASLKKQLLMA